MVRQKYVIPSPLLRNNFAVPDRGKRKKKEEVLLENVYGRIKIRCNGNFSITPTDMKNYIAALNCIYDQIHSFANKDQRWNFHQVGSQNGFYISFSDLIRYRGLKHHGKIYSSIEKSLEKLHLTNIKLENSYPELSSNKERQRVEQFYLIEKISIEKTKKDITNNYVISIKVPAFITQALLNKTNSCIAVEKEIINSLDGVAFNLYWTVLNNSFSNKKDQITFSWDYWINQSNFLSSNSGRKRPREAKDKIRKALNRLQKNGGIYFFQEKILSDNRKALSVKVVPKIEDKKTPMEIEATNMEIEATNMEIEATNGSLSI